MRIVGSMEQVGSRRAGRAVGLENHMACDLEEEEGTGMDMDMGIGLGVAGIGLAEEAVLMWVLQVTMSRNPI